MLMKIRVSLPFSSTNISFSSMSCDHTDNQVTISIPVRDGNSLHRHASQSLSVVVLMKRSIPIIPKAVVDV